MKWITLGPRRYGAHVPRRLGKSPALVVALHAGAQTPERFERMTGWSTLATRERFIVVYPEGLRKSWNAGSDALGYAGAHGVDDAGFVSAVVFDAAERWDIDGSRIYLSGFSNGSMLAHWWATEAFLDAAAIACVSGGFSRLPTEGAGDPPAVRMVHGFEDTHVPFAGGVGPDALDPYDHLPIEQTASWWRGQGAEITTVWRSGGHEWPGDETETQWEFFRGIG